VGENASARPAADLDHWRQSRERLTRLIAQIRIVTPLLHLRVLESGKPRSEALDDGVLTIARSADAVRIEFAYPGWCSQGEASRLTAVAAACLMPFPGWHLVGDAEHGRITAVLAFSAEDARRK
jgi:hypothetical protein